MGNTVAETIGTVASDWVATVAGEVVKKGLYATDDAAVTYSTTGEGAGWVTAERRTHPRE